MEQIDKQSFSIRLANKEDAWAMYQVEKNSFATPWSYDSFAENVRHGLSVYFLAEYSGQVVGFGGMLIVMEEAHIMNVAVLPNFRKKGIGRALLQAMIAEAGRRNASAMFLEARSAIKLPAVCTAPPDLQKLPFARSIILTPGRTL